MAPYAVRKAQYYGNLSRVAIRFALDSSIQNQETETHFAYWYARYAGRWARIHEAETQVGVTHHAGANAEE